MKYRYYIYKQSNLTSAFNKYDLEQYALLREIQTTTAWGLKVERDSEFYTVLRSKFNGEITVKGADFDALIALEGSHLQYAIVIDQYCGDSKTNNSLFPWKGFFSYFDFKPDLDRCYLSFEPSVWDIYTPVFDQMDVERNVLQASDGDTVLMDAYQWPTEELYHHFSQPGYPPAATWHEYNYTPIPTINYYYLYSQNTTETHQSNAGFHVDQVYKREIGFTTSDTIGPTGSSWTVIPDEYSPGVWKWVRPVGNAVYQTYTTVNSGWDRYETLDLPITGGTETITGCITLKSVLEYFALYFDLTYVSNFFNDNPCPMGGHSLVLTMIQQISNMRDTTEIASKGMMKLKDLLTWIRDTFNCYWFIDSNGDFRIEHRRYFDYGLSYSYTHIIELDIPAVYPDNVLKLRRYEWGKPSLFRFEKIEIPYSYFTDWIEAGIEYPQLSILGNNTKSTTIGWGTDLIALNDTKNDLPTTGWVLLNVEWVGPIGGPLIKKVINTVGALTGMSFQNARFSAANLLRDLWGFGRLLPTGNVNGVLTTFSSVERLRKQQELSFPQCCTDYDYNGLFRTALGDGMLDSAEYEAKSGNLKVQLIYE